MSSPMALLLSSAILLISTLFSCFTMNHHTIDYLTVPIFPSDILIDPHLNAIVPFHLYFYTLNIYNVLIQMFSKFHLHT